MFGTFQLKNAAASVRASAQAQARARGDEVCRFEVGPVSEDVRNDGGEEGRRSVCSRRHDRPKRSP